MPSGADVAVPLLPEDIWRTDVAPSTVTLPVNVLAPLPTTSVPLVTASPPVVVPITPLRVRVPAPALVIPNVAPEIAPPAVRVLAFTVTVRGAVRVTAPVPRLSDWVPVNVKS